MAWDDIPGRGNGKAGDTYVVLQEVLTETLRNGVGRHQPYQSPEGNQRAGDERIPASHDLHHLIGIQRVLWWRQDPGDNGVRAPGKETK